MIDPAEGEAARLRVREVPAADGAGGVHREALGEGDARSALGIEKLPEGGFLCVVRAGGATGELVFDTLLRLDLSNLCFSWRTRR